MTAVKKNEALLVIILNELQDISSEKSKVQNRL